MNYESEQDRANEERAANSFAGNFGLRQFKIGNHSPIDRAFANSRGVIVAFAEIKCHLDPDKNYQFREPRFGGGYLLNEKKLNAAIALNMATNCPVHLVVQFVDALVYLDLIRTSPEYGHSIGRDDRNDANDHYDAVRLSWSAFRVIRRLMTTTNEPRTTTPAVM